MACSHDSPCHVFPVSATCEQVLEEYYGIKPKKRPDLDPGEEDLTEKTEETEREDWNFPEDKEAWAEKDLGEEWADAPEDASAPFFDPNVGVGLGDDEDEDDDDSPRRSGLTICSPPLALCSAGPRTGQQQTTQEA